MKVHIFGSASSSNCAKYGLQQLASDHGSFSPAAENFIKNNFYVDDGLISCNSTEEAINISQNTGSIFQKGNLKLHKLLSNEQDVLNAFPKENWGLYSVDIKDGKHVERALGLKWAIHEDKFYFEYKPSVFSLTRGGIQ